MKMGLILQTWIDNADYLLNILRVTATLLQHIRPSIKKEFVCCTPTYPLLTPLPKTFLALLENKTKIVPFSSENHDFPIMQQ